MYPSHKSENNVDRGKQGLNLRHYCYTKQQEREMTLRSKGRKMKTGRK